MNEEDVSLVMLSRDAHVSPGVEYPKTTHDKYVHKKFKRIASLDVEDNSNPEKQSNNLPNAASTHIQSHINETIQSNELSMEEKRPSYNQCRFV